MAAHRRPRPPLLRAPASRGGAVGITTAAVASLTILAQSAAQAAPEDDGPSARPSVEEVRKQVDTLYREAGGATQEYNAAKEKADKQRGKVDRLLDEAAERADRLNDARRELGTYATAQYRTGGVSDTAVLLLSSDPQTFFQQRHLLERMTDRRQQAVEDYRDQRRTADRKRTEAAGELARLTESQKKLSATRKTVQGKLAEARKLLAKLTAEERARLAEQERKRQEEARRKAAAAAAERKKQQELAEAERAERAERAKRTAPQQTDTGTSTGTNTETGTGGTYAAKAAKAIAFAEAQLGKPYVWGATGPGSYDCSGLTGAAWRAAGISLPRTTWDQVETGTKVEKSRMQPGDLVFFYDDISHVGIYVGGGQMIHAPKPGAQVRYESVDHMPFHSAVRPA
ncbi:glycoside hydrolase [Streptomyces carminius]|uniref:Glycoside hydrolase n=1 Tax=Streptomyces carminius TaxID=2665496 RepID=A0A2M8LS26_9ACTN|nr:C40 family peptidase [Streptomyces carminius]PJE94772.1 glycoside hydrolase [Streptomyces carminius]